MKSFRKIPILVICLSLLVVGFSYYVHPTKVRSIVRNKIGEASPFVDCYIAFYGPGFETIETIPYVVEIPITISPKTAGEEIDVRSYAQDLTKSGDSIKVLEVGKDHIVYQIGEYSKDTRFSLRRRYQTQPKPCQ